MQSIDNELVNVRGAKDLSVETKAADIFEHLAKFRQFYIFNTYTGLDRALHDLKTLKNKYVQDQSLDIFKLNNLTKPITARISAVDKIKKLLQEIALKLTKESDLIQQNLVFNLPLKLLLESFDSRAKTFNERDIKKAIRGLKFDALTKREFIGILSQYPEVTEILHKYLRPLEFNIVHLRDAEINNMKIKELAHFIYTNKEFFCATFDTENFSKFALFHMHGSDYDAPHVNPKKLDVKDKTKGLMSRFDRLCDVLKDLFNSPEAVGPRNPTLQVSKTSPIGVKEADSLKLELPAFAYFMSLLDSKKDKAIILRKLEKFLSYNPNIAKKLVIGMATIDKVIKVWTKWSAKKENLENISQLQNQNNNQVEEKISEEDQVDLSGFDIHEVIDDLICVMREYKEFFGKFLDQKEMKDFISSYPTRYTERLEEILTKFRANTDVRTRDWYKETMKKTHGFEEELYSYLLANQKVAFIFSESLDMVERCAQDWGREMDVEFSNENIDTNNNNNVTTNSTAHLASNSLSNFLAEARRENLENIADPVIDDTVEDDDEYGEVVIHQTVGTKSY